MALKNSAETPLNWINHFGDHSPFESLDRARNRPLIESGNSRSFKEYSKFIKNFHKEEKRERKKSSIVSPFGKKKHFCGENAKTETRSSLRPDKVCDVHFENERLVRKKEEKRKKKSSIAIFFEKIGSHANDFAVVGDDSNLMETPERYITMVNVGIEALENNAELNYREHLLLERENDTRLFYPHLTTYFLISPEGDEHDELYLDINIEPIRKNMNPLKDIKATHYIVNSEINLTDDNDEGFLLISTEPVRSYDWYTNRKSAPEINERKTQKKDKTLNPNRVHTTT